MSFTSRFIRQSAFYFIVSTSLLILFLVGCKKSTSYYVNPSGLHDPKFNGTVMNYLDSRSDYFDTLSQIIRLAGMEHIYQEDSITFFAPPDSTISNSLSALNSRLFLLGRTQVTKLSQISSITWKKMLNRYTFQGLRRLSDYSQIDIANLGAFGGNYYQTLDSTLMNIGVVFTDLVSGANTIKYQGYRYLLIAYFPSEASPTVGRIYAQVASSDINPTNGIVHVLRILGGSEASNHYFGFSASDFINTVLNDGIDYTH